MSRILLCFLFFLGEFLTDAAAQSPSPNAVAPREKKSVAPSPGVQAAPPPSDSYHLASYDSVRITVFGEEDFSTTARIGNDLAIVVPRVGLVKIGGQTVREAAETIEGKLREYLVKPQVAVAIVGYSMRRFTILGQVGRPGTFEFPAESPSIDVLEAIGMAGGYTRLANPSIIRLKRTVNGHETLYKLDGKKMINKEASERFQVLAGDTILVGERLF